MGNKHSHKETTEDEDYIKFLQTKNKRDKERHKVISNQKGTAFHKLNEQDKTDAVN